MDNGEGDKGLRRRRTLGRGRASGKKANVKYGISRHDYGSSEKKIAMKKQEEKEYEEYNKRRSDRNDLGGYVSENSDDDAMYQKRFKELRQEYGYSLSDEILDYMATKGVTDVRKTFYWKRIKREEKRSERNEEELNFHVSEEENSAYEEDYESDEENVVEDGTNVKNKKTDKYDE